MHFCPLSPALLLRRQQHGVRPGEEHRVKQIAHEVWLSHAAAQVDSNEQLLGFLANRCDHVSLGGFVQVNVTNLLDCLAAAHARDGELVGVLRVARVLEQLYFCYCAVSSIHLVEDH